MNDVTTTKTQLPANFAARLGASISESRSRTIINAGGKPLLRLVDQGDWVFGQGDEAVQEGSRWVINCNTIGHGFVCWSQGAGVKGELLGEVMKSVFDPKPDKPGPIEGFPFKEQRSFDMKCLDGDDAGTEVLYKVSSMAGMQEVDKLFQAIHQRTLVEQVYIYPVVTLKVSSYKNKKFNKTIWTPILEIVGWSDENGTVASSSGKAAAQLTNDTDDDAPVMDTSSGPAQTQRKRKAPIGGTAPADAVPQTTQQVHAGRRRPGR